MNLEICSTEKRKGAPLVRVMRPWLFLGTRGTVLILPSFSTNGERCNYPFRSPLDENSPCRPFGTCELVAAVGSERLLDQLANHAFRELHGFLGGNADGLGGVADLSPEIRREADTFLAELVLEVGESDLSLANVVHNGPPVNVLLPRNPRSQDSQVHLRNALSIAENNLAVKSNRGNRKSPYFRAFYRFLCWIKKFSSPRMQNRQFVFEPKMQYALTAERSEAAVSNLQFPKWCPRQESVTLMNILIRKALKISHSLDPHSRCGLRPASPALGSIPVIAVIQ